MRHPWFLLRFLLLTLIAAPSLPQSVDQGLPEGKSLEIALWGADLSVLLRPGATPHLKAEAVTVDEGSEEAVAVGGPTVTLSEEASVLKVQRAAASEAVRLRVEVTLDVGHPLTITGTDLDVALEAPPIDFRKMEIERRGARERGEEMVEPAWTDLSLRLEDSRADLSGISGAALEGRNSWFVVRQSANDLEVQLEGGAAKLRRHRGLLDLEARGGEVEVRDSRGKIRFQMEGASLDVADAEGIFEGLVTGGATFLLFDWGGQVEVEALDSRLEFSGSRPGSQQLNVVAEGSDVTVEAMSSGQLEIDQKGGKLSVRDAQGKMKLAANHEADVELARLEGSWHCVVEGSTIVADEVERLEVELTDGALRLDDVQDLRLTATGSEVSATGVRRIRETLLTDTGADLELTEGSRAQVEARGQSRVSVRMPMPCFVLKPRGDSEAFLDVSGCTLGGNVGGSDPDAASPSFLTVTVGEEAELEVRGM